MSRWIDADALKKDIARLHILNDEAEIRRAYEYNPHSTTTDFEETLVSVFDAIDDAPSIDLVRCKECQYYEDGHCESAEMWQSINGYITECESMSRNADDFCSYGEREGE